MSNEDDKTHPLSTIFNDNALGTPKTLDAAIQIALCVGPLSEIKDRSYHVIKDFMAQKFGIAYLKATPETLKVLEELFKQLTKRDDEKS